MLGIIRPRHIERWAKQKPPVPDIPPPPIQVNFDGDDFHAHHIVRPTAVIGMVYFKKDRLIGDHEVMQFFPYPVYNYHEGKCL